MFRALSVSAAYLEGKIRIKIRVLGITVKRMGFDGERPGTRRRKKKEPPPFEEDEDEPEKAPRDRAGEEELQPEWLKGEKENRPPLPGEPREREPVSGKPSPPKKAGLPHRAAAVLRRIGSFLKGSWIFSEVCRKSWKRCWRQEKTFGKGFRTEG